jgi:hypothetical protein
MKTGGAKPAADPTAGYCFVNQMLGGFPVSPVTFNANVGGGAFSGVAGDLVMPIFFDAMAQTYVLLPLHAVNLGSALGGRKLHRQVQRGHA